MVAVVFQDLQKTLYHVFISDYRCYRNMLRIPFGDVGDWSLSRHQDTFLVETLQHLQWTVGQYHLLWGDLAREAGVT